MANVTNTVKTVFTADVGDISKKMTELQKKLEGIKPTALSKDMAKFGASMQIAGTRAAKAGGKLSMTLTPAMAGLGLAAFGATQKAADLQESITKTEAVFGSSAATIMDWSKTSATALGMSQRQALEAAGTYGNLLQAFGLTREQAVGMSQDITGLAADLASFNNVPMDDALLALRSGLSGETEPLKRFGIALNDQRLKLEAARIGLGEYTGVLPVAVKAQAAYSLIMKDSALAQGDFARTSDGLANQQRILRAEIEDAVAQFGQALMPILQSIVDFIRTNVIPFFQRLGDAFSGMSEGTRKMVVGLGAFLFALGPTLFIVGKMTSGIGGLITSLGMLDKALLKTRIASIATFVTNPAFLIIGGIVLLIAGLIGIFQKAYRESEVLRNAVSDAFNFIKNSIGAAINIIRSALYRNRETVVQLQVSFKALGDFIGKYIVPIFTKVLGKAIVFVGGLIGDVIDFIAFAIRNAVRAINLLLGAVETVINDAIKIINFAGAAIAKVTDKAFKPLEEITLRIEMGMGAAAEATAKYRDESEKAGITSKNTAAAIEEVDESLGGAGEKVKKAKDETIKLTSAMRNSLRAIVDFNAGSGDLFQTLGGNEISKFAQKLLNAKEITQDLADEFDDLVDVVKDKVSAALDAANDKLREQQALYDGVFNTVRDGVQGSFSLTEAIDASTESTQAVTEALRAQAEAQEKVNEAIRKGDEDAIAAANKDLDEANKQLDAAQKNEKGFLAFLKIGADQAIAFADQIDALRMAGASVALVQEVAKLGAQRGLIAVQELLRGGAAAIAEANQLIAAVETAANRVAKSSAEQFYGAGVRAAQAYVNALRDVLMPQLEALLNEIAEMLKRQNVSLGGGGGGGGGGGAPAPTPPATIPGIVPGTVVPIILPPEQIFDYEDAPEFFSPRFFATGGVVMKPTLGIVGEAGPEAVIPLSQYGAMGGNSYTINVNVPVSANRAEVGREIVDAIQAYERRNGRVYEPA